MLGKRNRNEFEGAHQALDGEFDKASRRNKRHRSMWVPMYDLLCGFVDRLEGEGGAQCEGDHRMKELRRLLDSFQWERSPDQFRFHEDFIRLCLPQIYGADFEANRARLMAAFGLDCFKVGALVLTPRRWGKTTSVCMFIAAMLIICDGIKFASFGPGIRATSMLLLMVVRLLYQANAGARIVAGGSTYVAVAVPALVDANGALKASARQIVASQRVNVLNAYPANAKGACRCCVVLCCAVWVWVGSGAVLS